MDACLQSLSHHALQLLLFRLFRGSVCCAIFLSFPLQLIPEFPEVDEAAEGNDLRATQLLGTQTHPKGLLSHRGETGSNHMILRGREDGPQQLLATGGGDGEGRTDRNSAIPMTLTQEISLSSDQFSRAFELVGSFVAAVVGALVVAAVVGALVAAVVGALVDTLQARRARGACASERTTAAG